MNNLDGLDVAKATAINSTFTNKHNKFIKMGAAIYYKNRCVAVGNNQNKTHTEQAYYNREMPYDKIPYLHAEVATLLAARWNIGKDNLKQCTIFIARKLNTNGWGNARPCPACMKALKDAGIKKLIYSTESGYAIEYITEIVTFA